VLAVLVKQCHSRCGLFGLLISKAGIRIDEERIQRTKDKRKQTRVLGGTRHLAAIHENVLLATVPVKITKYCYLTLFCECCNHLLRVVNCWMKHFAWLFPPSVQVAARQTAPVIAIYYAIRV
jgi:hypothetical protein